MQVYVFQNNFGLYTCSNADQLQSDGIYLAFANETKEIVRKPETIEVDQNNDVALIKVGQNENVVGAIREALGGG